jgi:hypothetical protein
VRLSALCAGRPFPLEIELVLISVRGWVGHRATVRLEGLGQLKNPVTSSGIEPMTFRLVPRAPLWITVHYAKYDVRARLLWSCILQQLCMGTPLSHLSAATIWSGHYTCEPSIEQCSLMGCHSTCGTSAKFSASLFFLSFHVTNTRSSERKITKYEFKNSDPIIYMPKITVFWNVTTCSLVEVDRRFEGK